jgi:hypothetical protein
MAGVSSGSKMYRTSTVAEIHTIVDFVQKLDCTKYILQRI